MSCIIIVFSNYKYRSEDAISGLLHVRNVDVKNVSFTFRQNNEAISADAGGTDNPVIHGEIQMGSVLHKVDMSLNININLTGDSFSEILANVIKQPNGGSQHRESMKDSGKKCGTVDSREKLLTLFTTVSVSESRQPIFQNTLRNWIKFKPYVMPVLFADDQNSRDLATENGWSVLTIPKVAENGLPVLKFMFKKAAESFCSKFYGYANADILFTSTLTETLTAVDYSDFMKNVTFLTGRRTNVMDIASDETQELLRLTSAARNRGQLFQVSAEDYFITGSGYNWDEGPEVVVGSLAYDNWLVFAARSNQHPTIDCTKTILAVHQSRTKTSLYQSHHRETSEYNFGVIRKYFHGLSPPYQKGFTHCIELHTMKEDGQVAVKSREISGDCNL